MWSRAVLKEAAKINFNKAYKQSVIVCIIVYIIGAVFSGVSNSSSNTIQNNVNYNQYYEYEGEFENYEETIIDSDPFFTFSVDGVMGSFFDKILDAISNPLSMTLITLVMTSIMILSSVIRAIIYNPIIVGKNNFFMGVREEERKVGDIFFLFDKSKFLKPAWTMFCMDFFIFLWTLLLFIPGIYKSLEYSMIPYILAENPEIDRSRAFELSKHMMNGQIWDVFVLDLSFIGWHLLSSITFGIVGIFYVNPYRESTFAELYAVLREGAIEDGFTNKDELPGFKL